MFDHSSLRFFVNLIIGNVLVDCCLGILRDVFGTIRSQPKIEITRKMRTRMDIFWTLVAGVVVWGGFWGYKPVQRLMDIPSIISRDYMIVEGRVKSYSYDDGGIIGGRLTVKDADGKLYRFIDIDVPSDLEKGDWVEVDYWKYSRIGVIAEINGVGHGRLTYRYLGLTIVLIVFLLLAMPFYSFRIFKWKPFFNWKEDYSICVYHDLLVRGIFSVQVIMLQSAVVLVIAIMGKYQRFLDWYWGILICTNYLGIFCLSLFRHRRFVVIKDKFYYCSFKRRMEGRLEEIDEIQRGDKGILICAKGEELEILCTKEKYVDTLMEKLLGRKEKNG